MGSTWRPLACTAGFNGDTSFLEKPLGCNFKLAPMAWNNPTKQLCLNGLGVQLLGVQAAFVGLPSLGISFTGVVGSLRSCIACWTGACKISAGSGSGLQGMLLLRRWPGKSSRIISLGSSTQLSLTTCVWVYSESANSRTVRSISSKALRSRLFPRAKKTANYRVLGGPTVADK